MRSTATVEEDKENTSDAVTLVTMRSCKGLEFPQVFIVGLEDGLLPHSRSKVEGTMDEERRLFYVAVMRTPYRRCPSATAVAARNTAKCCPAIHRPFSRNCPRNSLSIPTPNQNARRTGIGKKSLRRHACGNFVKVLLSASHN